MQTNLSCPVSLKTIHEKQPRIVAGLVAVLTLVFGISGNIGILTFLWADFLLRAFGWSKYSPLFSLSKMLIKKFSIKGNKVDVAPKVFAAKLGFILTTLLLAVSYFFYIQIGVYSAFLLLVFALLESVGGICIGCIIYQQLFKYGWIK